MAFEMAFCQCPPQQMVNSNYQFRAAGSDTALRMPQTQNVSTCWLTPGAIEFNGPDSTTYQWTGTEWIKLRGAGSAGGLTQIFGKNHISVAGTDTAVFDTLQYRKIYNVVSFGADSTFATDATPGIQAAYNAAAANGGGMVYYPRGHYKIGGALNAACNCQIFIPAVAAGSSYRSAIVSVGEMAAPVSSGYNPANSSPPPTAGVVLTSTISGSGSLPGLIGTAPVGGLNIQDIVFENFNVQVWSNGGTQAPTMSGLVFQGANSLYLVNVAVNQDVNNVNTKTPVNSEIAGIILGQISNGGPNVLMRVSVGGFKYGIVSVEHTVYDNVQVFASYYAYVFPRANFSARGTILTHGCKHQLYFPSTVVMGQNPGNAWVNMDIEEEVDTLGTVLDTTWYAFVDDVTDTSNHAHGTIHINKKQGSSGLELSNNLTKQGGLFLDMVSYNSTVPGNAVIQAIDTTSIQFNQNVRWNPAALQWIHINGGPGESIPIASGFVIFRAIPTAPPGGTSNIGSQVEQLTLTPTGSNGMGTPSPNASCLLDMQSTTRGLGPPPMTTVQKLAIASPRSGLMVYDTTLNQMSYFNGTTWTNF